MTQTPQRQECPQGSPSHPEETSSGPLPSLPPNTESISDNDTNEKSAREKLKKTSLASLSRHIMNSSQAEDGVQTESMTTIGPASEGAAVPQNLSQAAQPRGRPVRKRSFHDLEHLEKDNSIFDEAQTGKANGHARKRSRDVRAGELSKAEGRPQATAGIVVQEEAEDKTESQVHNSASEKVLQDSKDTVPLGTEAAIPEPLKVEESIHCPVRNHSSQKDAGTRVESADPEVKKDASDQETKDGGSSPRKKRNRDQSDTEANREQKIVATEEARAQRTSEEIDRAEAIAASKIDIAPKEDSRPKDEQTLVHEAVSETPGPDRRALKDPPKSTFGTPSTLPPLTAPPVAISPAKASAAGTNVAANDPSRASSAAFASSGFAALSSSSTSPFGALGRSTTTATSSPFASSAAISPKKLVSDGKSEPQAKAGFGSFAKSTSSGFGGAEISAFNPSGATKGSVFGGSVFSGGFGSGLGGGSRLTSFAAPTGNAKLGNANGAFKPIVSPTRDGDHEDDRSESEGDGTEEKDKDIDSDEVDERFQHQDVETGEDGEETKFASRASLYSFKENAWKESGKGTFKLNIAAPPEVSISSQKSGRFLMRAHQTYRVLLNAPIFKQMKIGDSRGNEPSGKAFAFAVIEDGKPTPYMVKLGDVNESRALYHEVQKLQHGLA